MGKENLTQGDVEFAGSSLMSDVFEDPPGYINLNKRPEDDYESTDVTCWDPGSRNVCSKKALGFTPVPSV